MKKILKVISCLWFFLWGNLFALFMYDKKYLKGKYFQSKYGGILAIGWRWVVADFWGRVFLGVNRNVKFPISPFASAGNAERIIFDVDDICMFQARGSRFQVMDRGKIVIGKGTWIANNVGVITTNHDIANPDLHVEGTEIRIGEHCWIGMNAMILPGVVLGNHTVVGAGAVVTKSFPEGYCIIAGNPAKKIKYIELDKGGENVLKKNGNEV